MPAADEPIPRRKAIEFVLRLARALHEAGTPAPRLEEALTAVSTQLGLTAAFFSTPTSILAAFGEEGASQRTCMIRVEPSSLNLERLIRIDEVATAVGSAEMTAEQGADELDRIATATPRYGPLTTIACCAVASAGSAAFLGGSWSDVAASGFVGLIVGALMRLAIERPQISLIVELVGGAMAAMLALLAERYIPGARSGVITVSGIIVLLPGLTLTLAMSELASRHLVSGSSRLFAALMVLILISMGVAVGRQITPLLPPLVDSAHVPVASWAAWSALAIVPLAFTVLFKARPRDYVPIAIAGAIGILGATRSAPILGVELSAGLGAFLVGSFANVYSRVLLRPSSIPKLPGIVLLVPGSLGFRSVQSFLDADAISGITTAFSMILIAVSLAAGLLLANVAVKSRKTL